MQREAVYWMVGMGYNLNLTDRSAKTLCSEGRNEKREWKREARNTSENEKLLFCAWDSSEILPKKLSHQLQNVLMHREATINVADQCILLDITVWFPLHHFNFLWHQTSHTAISCIFNNSCNSITIQIAQTEIKNWKYTQWKCAKFAKTPINCTAS